MPIVSALFMSIMMFIAYTGSQQVDWRLRSIEGPRTSFQPIRSYEPPARKSIIVDNDGQAHPTAAPSHATKRDRSRTIYRSRAPITAPNLNIVQDDFKLAEPKIAPQEIVPQAAPPALITTESSLIVPSAVPEPTLIDPDDSFVTDADRLITNRIRQAILDDNALYIVSMHVRVSTTQGIATLIGEVSTLREKNIIESKAVSVAGSRNVKNELSVLVG